MGCFLAQIHNTTKNPTTTSRKHPCRQLINCLSMNPLTSNTTRSCGEWILLPPTGSTTRKTFLKMLTSASRLTYSATQPRSKLSSSPSMATNEESQTYPGNRSPLSKGADERKNILKNGSSKMALTVVYFIISILLVRKFKITFSNSKIYFTS